MQLTKGIKISEDNVTNIDYIHRKVAQVLTLLIFILLIILGISDFFMKMSPVIAWLKISLSLPFLLGYYLVYKRVNTVLVINFLLIIGHIVVIFNFIFNNGIQGPTLYACFLLLVLYSLMVRGWQKVVWFIVSLSMFFALLYAEEFGYIEMQNFYISSKNQLVDHIVTIGWMSIFIFVVLHFFINSYRNQNQVLNSIKQKQEETLEEVEMLNDQKNRLIALLSHDLKNPIGMLHTTLQLVEEEALEDGELELIILNLKQQSYHLDKVLKNTLSWVMMELHDEEKEMHLISMKDLVEEMRDMMMVQALVKHQVIDISIQGVDREKSIPSNEVKIILKNFLDNAIKFSDEHTSISLSVHLSEHDIQWRVSNRGEVMDDDKTIESLFKFKARSSYGTQREKGTGIGLPLCKRIADKIGYEISYQSSDSDLNCFILTAKLD